MIQLQITQSFESVVDMENGVEYILDLIREGYTSGYYPHWTITGEQELPPEQHDEDCDYRLSSAAREVDESEEIYPCNLGCNDI